MPTWSEIQDGILSSARNYGEVKKQLSKAKDQHEALGQQIEAGERILMAREKTLNQWLRAAKEKAIEEAT